MRGKVAWDSEPTPNKWGCTVACAHSHQMRWQHWEERGTADTSMMRKRLSVTFSLAMNGFFDVHENPRSGMEDIRCCNLAQSTPRPFTRTDGETAPTRLVRRRKLEGLTWTVKASMSRRSPSRQPAVVGDRWSPPWVTPVKVRSRWP